jgi:hypothetical protein
MIVDNREIEILAPELELGARYLYVDFKVSGKYVDKSFSYEYGSIRDVYEDAGWEDVDVTWDRKKFNDQDNEIIENYVKENLDSFIDELGTPKKY